MTAPTPPDTAALRALAEAATKPPWKFPHQRWPDMVMTPRGCLWNPGTGYINEPADAALLVAAVNALPGLLDENEKLRNDNEILAARWTPEQLDKVLECARSARFEDLWSAGEAERDELRARLVTLEAENQRLLAALSVAESESEMGKALAEVRTLWQNALEREGNLASAVADVIWKATQFGETDDGDTYSYIVPKGCMHRLAGVAQQNGAHVPVAFRAPTAESDVALRPVGSDARDGER